MRWIRTVGLQLRLDPGTHIDSAVAGSVVASFEAGKATGQLYASKPK